MHLGHSASECICPDSPSAQMEGYVAKKSFWLGKHSEALENWGLLYKLTYGG